MYVAKVSCKLWSIYLTKYCGLKILNSYHYLNFSWRSTSRLIYSFSRDSVFKWNGAILIPLFIVKILIQWLPPAKENLFNLWISLCFRDLQKSVPYVAQATSVIWGKIIYSLYIFILENLGVATNVIFLPLSSSFYFTLALLHGSTHTT